MDHFPRLRPHRRKREITAPSLITTPTITAKSDSTSEKTESPASAELHTPVVAPSLRPVHKLSPFRVFSRSSKRARESSPSSHKQTPTAAAVMAPHGTADIPASPAESKTSSAQLKHDGRPKMPSFLDLSESEIENKFQEIVWLERKRVLEATQNPSRDFRWARVNGKELRDLDRYRNIQPWYNNRIKLKVPEGKVDYINASPIVLNPTAVTTADGESSNNTQEPDRYIAMQGPIQCTTDHVWRMAVEQLESPGVIVMLTETHEGDFEKCYPYFPQKPEDPPLEINERDEFGDGFRATVRCAGIGDTPAGDAIELRKILIRIRKPKARQSLDGKSNGSQSKRQTPEPESATTEEPNITSPLTQMSKETETNLTISEPAETVGRNSGEEEVEERIVWHFLYKKWPDFGVPDLDDLDSFFTLMALSREKNAGPHNPRIVHCSAGVGRSGTFIALEHLMRELDAGVLENWDERCAAVAAAADGESKSASSSARTSQEEEIMSPTCSAKGGEDNDLIFQVVNRLREQRKTMVQAESQYQFIYQVMRKLWLEKYGSDGEDGERAAKRLEVDPGDPFFVNGCSK